MYKVNRELFDDEHHVGSNRWQSFSNRTEGPSDVMREVTAEAVKRIQAIFERPKKDLEGRTTESQE
jgi:hypothetical protein